MPDRSSGAASDRRCARPEGRRGRRLNRRHRWRGRRPARWIVQSARRRSSTVSISVASRSKTVSSAASSAADRPAAPVIAGSSADGRAPSSACVVPSWLERSGIAREQPADQCVDQPAQRGGVEQVAEVIGEALAVDAEEADAMPPFAHQSTEDRIGQQRQAGGNRQGQDEERPVGRRVAPDQPPGACGRSGPSQVGEFRADAAPVRQFDVERQAVDGQGRELHQSILSAARSVDAARRLYGSAVRPSAAAGDGKLPQRPTGCGARIRSGGARLRSGSARLRLGLRV